MKHTSAVNAENAESQDRSDAAEINPPISIKAENFDLFAPVPEDMQTTRKGKTTPMMIGKYEESVNPIPGVPEKLEDL